jgi:hypothetical protein
MQSCPEVIQRLLTGDGNLVVAPVADWKSAIQQIGNLRYIG